MSVTTKFEKIPLVYSFTILLYIIKWLRITDQCCGICYWLVLVRLLNCCIHPLMSVSRISATSCDWVIADFLPHPVLEWSQNASGPFTFASSPSTIQVHWNDVWYFKQSGRHLWPTNSKCRWQIHLGSWSKQSRPQRVVDIGKPKMRRNRSSVFSIEGRKHK